MYANLRVTTSMGKIVYAWKVDRDSEGFLTAYLDKNDGTGNYAEPGGAIRLSGPVTIAADF